MAVWQRSGEWCKNKNKDSCRVSHHFLIFWFKWPIFSQTGKIGTDKNTKYLFFLLGLKYSLSTCFEHKKVLSNSCPELRYQVHHFSVCKISIVSKSGLEFFFFFQILDNWMSSLDIMNDFKSRVKNGHLRLSCTF